MSDSHSSGSTNGPQKNQGTESRPPIPKMYLGNLQEKIRRNGDRFLIGSICLEDIQNIPDEHKKPYKNGKTYVKIIVNPYKDGPNKHGNTHSISVDTYWPPQAGEEYL